MRAHGDSTVSLQQPILIDQAQRLAEYVRSLTPQQLATCMHLSDSKASKTYELWQSWSRESSHTLPAIDSFIGDIYSGLQAQTFTDADRSYANDHLYILSGLYGILRALDSITPYRLEMGYRLPAEPYRNLYAFWGDSIACQLPKETTLLNLSAVEYTNAVLPYMQDTRVVTPKFMTIDKTGQPSFVVVHAKIARGAFACWLIKNRVDTIADLRQFADLNYRHNPDLSTSEQPVFICKTFGGLGLSVRLS